MSKVRLAEYHYRKALEIHPRNAVLMGCVGMVSSSHFGISFGCDKPTVPICLRLSQAVERREDREGALELFDRAVRLAPENALVRYRRAKILVFMRKYEVRNSKFRLPYIKLNVDSFVQFLACSPGS
jgi:anaphase-promoting complex subunit 3